MKYAVKFDKDALVKALLIAAGAALAAVQPTIPSLGLDPTLSASATLLVAVLIAAISRAEKPADKPAP